MKFIQKVTWDLGGDLEYYKNQLHWNVDTIEDVVEYFKDLNDDELYLLLGPVADYECWAEETEAEEKERK